MKRPLRPSRCLLLPTFLAVLPALGQGTFQNLDFEAATIQQTQASGNVSSTDAFPGWTVYYDTNQQTQVGSNGECFGSTCIWLLGTNGSFASSLKSIEGGFSALLQGGVSGSGPSLHTTAASIRQTGFVPTTSRSILFKAQEVDGIFTVSLDGVSIPYSPLSNGPNYTVFGGDVSAFAGRTVELDFSLLRQPGADHSDWILDSIQFSDLAVPEPSILSLSALGAFLLGWRFVSRRRR